MTTINKIQTPAQKAAQTKLRRNIAQKALRSAKWARTMTKWLITHSSKDGVKWQLVEFGGKKGHESYGIVDLIAIRKNHKPTGMNKKRGDLFEIILIQVKGGSARYPSSSDVARLLVVKKHHNASRVVLAEWKLATKLCLYDLTNPKRVKPIEIRAAEVQASEVFGKVPKITDSTILSIKSKGTSS